MKIKEIMGLIGAILMIPIWGLVILIVIIIGFFKHRTVNQTMYWLFYEPIENNGDITKSMIHREPDISH